jgi:hypothetical protein
MRKFLIIALILGFVLSGCTTMDPDHDTTNTLDSHLSEPSEDWSSQTDSTESLEGTASGPVASEPTLPTPTVPDPSENSTDETQSPQQATETPTTLTEPTEVTKPTQTLPPETTPTQLAEPWIEETGQPVEIVDASQIAAEANSYAVSLGFVVDNSLNKGNSGYYSPDYRPIVTNEIGTAAARDLVSATKNQLNSRFSESYSPTLLESIFGLVRVNCVVEYSHTDELGDWYYIYVFYG